MNNHDIILQLIEDLAQDEEYMFAKEDLELSRKDELLLIKEFVERANILDDKRKKISFEQWKELFLYSIDLVTNHSFNHNGAIRRENNYISKSVDMAFAKAIFNESLDEEIDFTSKTK